MGGRRVRAEDLDDRVDRHAMGGIQHELVPLGEISSHIHQAAERFGPELRDHARRALPQLDRLPSPSRLRLFGDLEEVADDHLVVGGALLVLVDGLRHHRRLEIGSDVVVVHSTGQRGPRQSDPELRALGPLGLGAERLALLVQELQPVVGHGVQLDVVPMRDQVPGLEPDRLRPPARLAREELQRLLEFSSFNALGEAHRPQVVPVEASGELRTAPGAWSRWPRLR